MQSDNELIKNSNLTQEELNLLREKFLNEYSKEKGKCRNNDLNRQNGRLIGGS